MIEAGVVWWVRSRLVTGQGPFAGSGVGGVCEIGRIRVCEVGDEFAVAHDGDVLHKHGASDQVRDWADALTTQVASVTRGMPPATVAGVTLPDVTILAFPATEETLREVNRCARTTGRVSRLAERLRDILDDDTPGPGP